MSESPLISIIVPVYRVEKYLDRCVQSIADQAYTNLEIILVDDGSPDHCPAICEAWAAKDSRVKVIHKENGGLSDARNAGMAIATGDLIGFVDSDDYIAPDMYQLLYENMVENQSDISACGVEMVWNDGTPTKMLTKAGCYVMETLEAMQAVVEESWLKQPVWYKLYKTCLVRDIPFPVGKYHEDVFWSYQAVGRARKVSVFDTPCYFYLQREGSIMGEGYSLRRLDALEAKQQRLEYLEQIFPSLANAARTDLLFACMHHGQLALQNLDDLRKKNVISKLESMVKQHSGKMVNMPAMYKCWILLAKQNLKLCCEIRNRLGIGN